LEVINLRHSYYVTRDAKQFVICGTTKSPIDSFSIIVVRINQRTDFFRIERQICSFVATQFLRRDPPDGYYFIQGGPSQPKDFETIRASTLMKFLSNMIRRSDDDLSREAKRAPVIDDVWSGGIA
jgi:hypothetical protein